MYQQWIRSEPDGQTVSLRREENDYFITQAESYGYELWNDTHGRSDWSMLVPMSNDW